MRIHDCGCEHLSLVLTTITFMSRAGENKYLVRIGYNPHSAYETELETENNLTMSVDFIFLNELGLRRHNCSLVLLMYHILVLIPRW